MGTIFREPNFDRFFQYGCWCFPDGETNVLGGYGKPKDEIDRVISDVDFIKQIILSILDL